MVCRRYQCSYDSGASLACVELSRPVRQYTLSTLAVRKLCYEDARTVHLVLRVYSMCLMDRHIAAMFVRTFAICFVSFAGLFVVIDAFQNLDSFLDFGRAQGGLLGAMAKYYYYRCLMMFEMTAPLLTLVSAMFTVANLQRWNEMTALMAAGMPKRRILAPILVSAAAIFLAIAAARELYLPVVRDEPGIGRNAQDLAGNMKRELTPLLDERTGVWFKGGGSLLASKTVLEPDFRLPAALAEYGEAIRGASAEYHGRSGPRPAGYLVRKVTFPTDFAQKPSLALPDIGPVILTPKDAPELLKEDELYLVTQVTFDQLTGGATWRKYGSIRELVAGLRNPSLRLGEDVELAVHSRIIQPLLDMTLLLLGFPLMVANNRRNIWTSMGQCMLTVAGFVLSQQIFQQLATQGVLSPPLAAWLPLMVFAPFAALVSEPLWEWNDERSEISQVAAAP